MSPEPRSVSLSPQGVGWPASCLVQRCSGSVFAALAPKPRNIRGWACHAPGPVPKSPDYGSTSLFYSFISSTCRLLSVFAGGCNHDMICHAFAMLPPVLRRLAAALLICCCSLLLIAHPGRASALGQVEARRSLGSAVGDDNNDVFLRRW